MVPPPILHSGFHSSCGNYSLYVAATYYLDIQSTVEITYYEMSDTDIIELMSSSPWTGLPLTHEEVRDLLNDATVPTCVQNFCAISCIHDYIINYTYHERELIEQGFVPTIFVHITTNDGSQDLADYDYEPDLHSIKSSGVPNHVLKLKIGVPVMLLRNIDQASGLCNGTRLIITKLGTRMVEGKIISGRNIGQTVPIPRMLVSPSDSTLPFKFECRQFPIIVCFGMTINKSQGQSLSQVGLYLLRPVFTHGQLYVASSRVTSMEGLKVLILDKNGKAICETTNVVYKEVLQNI